ncbi:MAG: HAD family hydrolase [Clostridia bacterium]|nr:HAD family hydrolase [Clostridia bacterium]
MIKAVIFDFDHTLYDRWLTYEKFYDGFVAQFGDCLADLPRQEMIAKMHLSDQQGLYINEWPGIYDKYVENGVFTQAPGFENFFPYVKKHYPEAIVVHTDAVETMDALHALGVKTGILTNCEKGAPEYQHDKIDRTPLRSYMDAILTSAEAGYEKPDARAFLKICEKLGVKPEEAVYVGDNPVKDVCGARGVCMTPVWMRFYPVWPEALPRGPYEIDHLIEVVDIVKELNK